MKYLDSNLFISSKHEQVFQTVRYFSNSVERVYFSSHFPANPGLALVDLISIMCDCAPNHFKYHTC